MYKRQPVFRTKDESYFLSAYLYLVTGDKKYFAEMRNLYVHVRNQYNNPASTYDGMDDMRWVDRIQQLRQYLVMQAALKKAGRPIERPDSDGNMPIYNGAFIRVMNKAAPITIGATKAGGRALLLSISPEHRAKVQVVGPDEKPVALVDQSVAGKPGLAVPSQAADGGAEDAAAAAGDDFAFPTISELLDGVQNDPVAGKPLTVRALHQLATLPAHPDSLPVNDLMPISGTPLGGSTPVDGLEFVRMIAVARIVCPRSVVRLSAGREHMSRELQALCFLAGANSIFVGARLLTTANPDKDTDEGLLADLKMRPMTMGETAPTH